MNVELKPCPFCGCEAAVSTIAVNIVECTGCTCRLITPPMDTKEATAAYAIDQWNTRHEQTCEVDEDGMCTVCHHEIASEVVGDNETVYAKFCGECGSRVVER